MTEKLMTREMLCDELCRLHDAAEAAANAEDKKAFDEAYDAFKQIELRLHRLEYLEYCATKFGTNAHLN